MAKKDTYNTDVVTLHVGNADLKAEIEAFARDVMGFQSAASWAKTLLIQEYNRLKANPE